MKYVWNVCWRYADVNLWNRSRRTLAQNASKVSPRSHGAKEVQEAATVKQTPLRFVCKRKLTEANLFRPEIVFERLEFGDERLKQDAYEHVHKRTPCSYKCSRALVWSSMRSADLYLHAYCCASLCVHAYLRMQVFVRLCN